jgi:hypothetical protein
MKYDEKGNWVLGRAVLVLFKSNEKNKSSEITKKKKKKNRIDLLEIHTHIYIPKTFYRQQNNYTTPSQLYI